MSNNNLTYQAGETGIKILMDDLGSALSDADTNSIEYMFGGGNPAHIPEIEEYIYNIINDLLKNKSNLFSLIGDYDTPQGYMPFLETLATFFNKTIDNKTDKELSINNFATTTGSQSGTFILQNILSKDNKKILLPLMPEYIGYMDQLIDQKNLIGILAKEELDEKNHSLKYVIDFEKVEIALQNFEIGAMFISRPTNPTGNVVSDEEILKLIDLANQYDCYLVLDNAYGLPWPNAIYVNSTLFFDKNVINTFSLSKIGLPMARVGIVLAEEDIIDKVKNVNSIIGLATPNFGQYIFNEMLKNENLETTLSIVKNFYETKSELAKETIYKNLDTTKSWFLHKHEGSFFFWLYLPSLSIDTQELYNILVENKILIVPSKYYYCNKIVDDLNQVSSKNLEIANKSLRINFARDEKEIVDGLTLMCHIINQYIK